VESAAAQLPKSVQLDEVSVERCVEAAAAARNSGDLKGALQLWQRVRQMFPDDPRGFAGCGTLLRETDNLDEADSLLTEGVRRFPHDQAIVISYAWVAHSRGDWGEANRRWGAARAKFPACLDGYFGGGASLKAAQRYDDADEVYISAFARFPVSAGMLGDFAAVAQARGDTAEASRRWIAARTLFPNRADVLLREARAFRDVGLLSAAEILLAEIVDRYPTESSALIALAQVAQQRGRWSEALSRWEAVVSQCPGVVDGYVGAATVLNELGRYADTQAILQPAVRKFPDSIAAASLAAWTEHYRQNYSDALQRWKAFRERFPGDSTGYLGAAASLTAIGKVTEAAELLESAWRLFPRNPAVAIHLARLPPPEKEPEEVVRRWLRARERFPDNAQIIAGYAVCLAKSGKREEADKMLQGALTRHVDTIDVLQAYAECAAAARDWSNAEVRWREAIDKFPQNIRPWVGLGEVLRTAGKLEESQRVLTTALERFPDNLELERHIAVTVSAQRAWSVALPMWEKLKRRYPRNPHVLSGITQALWQAQQDQGVGAIDGTSNALPFEIPALLLEGNAADGDREALRALFMKFESLGDTCEFGIVQRRFEAEPISLLRWSSIQPEHLIRALDSDFDGVGDAENTIVEASHGEYVTRDKRYHMFSHTFTPETTEPLAKFATQHLRRMKFLRKKLIEDLGTGEKILVYKSVNGVSDEQARGILRSIRRYGGQSVLLCVRLENGAQTSGTLTELEEGLFIGYIDRFSTVDINVDAWVKLCSETERQWNRRSSRLIN
jgi:tetratricopeptide (TPR) repeat protein